MRCIQAYRCEAEAFELVGNVHDAEKALGGYLAHIGMQQVSEWVKFCYDGVDY
jgi:hypothetical protein